MNMLGRLWRGELPLQDAFWLWAVAGGLIVNLLSSLGFLLLMLGEQIVLAIVVGYALSVPYNILVLVGVWRSANRYEGEPRWADLARMVTVAGMILLSVT